MTQHVADREPVCFDHTDLPLVVIERVGDFSDEVYGAPGCEV